MDWHEKSKIRNRLPSADQMARYRKIVALKREGLKDSVVAAKARVSPGAVHNIWAEHKDHDMNSISLHLPRRIAGAIESEFGLKNMTVIDLCHLVEENPGWRVRLLSRNCINMKAIKDIHSFCRKQGIRMDSWVKRGELAGLTKKTYGILKKLVDEPRPKIKDAVELIWRNPRELREAYSRNPEFEKEMYAIYHAHYRR